MLEPSRPVLVYGDSAPVKESAVIERYQIENVTRVYAGIALPAGSRALHARPE